ncbi:MAG: hypothetical protein JST76_12210 [Bacteroidetes bacterium]|nr:hypothetical protein [Bacteroidota bacterium]
MDLTILSVANKKDPEVEYVRLKVLKATSLKGYVLMDTTFSKSGKISNEHRHIFEFPDIQVKEGDFLWVYSGEDNKYSSFQNDGKTVTHKFYWGSKGFIWNDNGRDTVRLVKMEPIDSHTVPKATK